MVDIIHDDFEDFGIEIDSELVNKDLDDIDLFAEDKFEYEDYDDGGILYE